MNERTDGSQLKMNSSDLMKKARDLKLIASTWSLSEDEIKGCINKALAKTGANQSLRKSHSCKKILLLFACFIVLGALVVSKTVLKFVRYHQGRVFRTFRRVAILLHEFVDLSYYDSRKCFVNNPLYSLSRSNCYFCADIYGIKVAPRHLQISLKDLTFPVLFRERLNKTVELKDIQQILLQMNESTHLPLFVASKYPWLKTITDLATADIKDKMNSFNDFNFRWATFSAELSYHLKQTFGRSKSFPQSVIGMYKMLIVDGPKSKAYNLPEMEYGDMIYLQGSGMRRIVLTPPPECEDVCVPLTVRVNQTDILFYPGNVYTAKVVQAGSTTSIALWEMFD